MFKRKVDDMRSRLHVVTAVSWFLLYTGVMPVSAAPSELNEVMQAIEDRIHPDGSSACESLFVLRDLETVDTPPPVTGMQTRRVRLTWKGDDYWLAAAYDYDTTPSRRAAVASYFPGNVPEGNAYHPRPVARFASRVAGIGRSVTLLRKHCVSASEEPCGYTESLFVANDPPGDSHMEFSGFRDMILGGFLA
ncbi:MAG: hypothetical protein N2111_01955 [Candidatus Sumerlaeaceae bacterium]|nr:hypothetical protein [Candidatus Sumerlaeaceae bacterium]